MNKEVVIQEEQSRRKPVLYAGKQFYDVFVDTMKLTQVAALQRDYAQWLIILQQFSNFLSGFSSTKHTTTFMTLRRRLYRSQVLGMQGHNTNTILFNIENDILNAEREFYFDIKDLILATGGESMDDFDIERLRSEMT